MNNILPFLALITIWTTTPLSVKISASGIDPYSAILLRMLIAVIFGHMLLKIFKINLPLHRAAVLYYLVSNIGFTIGLTLVYISATMIPSGLISLLFGCSPIFCRFFGEKLLGEPALTPLQWVGFVTAMVGLATVLGEQDLAKDNVMLGICINIVSVIFFCFSSVLLKKINLEAHPLSKSVGAISFSIPPLAIVWLLLGQSSETLIQSPASAWYAIFYLAIFSSLIGQAIYFHILQRTSPTILALTSLITPIFALYLSDIIEGAEITLLMMIGAVTTISGLAIFVLNIYRPVASKRGP